MRRELERKPLYGIAELGRFFKKHRNTMARLLTSAGVEFTRSGRRRYVSLVELEAKMPELTRWLFPAAVDESDED